MLSVAAFGCVPSSAVLNNSFICEHILGAPCLTGQAAVALSASGLRPELTWREKARVRVRVDFIVVVEPFWQQGQYGFGVQQDDVSSVVRFRVWTKTSEMPLLCGERTEGGG